MELPKYNTERKALIIQEYGRHVQKMINYAISVPNREKRNELAHAIVSVMKKINPKNQDISDYKHKLWIQLFIMSDFELDVDSPFEKPDKSLWQQSPPALKYLQKFPKYRFYGNNIQRMIELAVKWKEDSWKKSLIYIIANQMKKSFLIWNKNTIEDDSIIVKHMEELSAGALSFDPSEIALTDSSALLKMKTKKKEYYSNSRSSNSRNSSSSRSSNSRNSSSRSSNSRNSSSSSRSRNNNSRNSRPRKTNTVR